MSDEREDLTKWFDSVRAAEPEPAKADWQDKEITRLREKLEWQEEEIALLREKRDWQEEEIAVQEMKIARLAEHLEKSREKKRSQREELARLNAKADWQDKEITRLIIDRDQARSDNAFNAYQKKAAQTAFYPEDQALDYLIPGLAAEAGEVAGKWAKAIRDRKFLYAEEVLAEVGDVLWFVSEIARHYGVDLDEVAECNLRKLADRKNRGVLGGSGDHR